MSGVRWMGVENCCVQLLTQEVGKKAQKGDIGSKLKDALKQSKIEYEGENQEQWQPLVNELQRIRCIERCCHHTAR